MRKIQRKDLASIDEDEIVIGFYKAFAKGQTFNQRLTAWFTKGPYSHVAFVVKEADGIYEYSATFKEEMVCKIPHEDPETWWDYYVLKISNKDNIFKFFKMIEGKPYDMFGIVFSQILPLGVDNPSKWFCSEFVTKALLVGGVTHHKLWLYKPEYLSPNKLAFVLGCLPKYESRFTLFKKHVINREYD